MATWQRLAGLLLLFCMLDMVQWSLDHAPEMGLAVGSVGHEWLRSQLSRGMGWLELILIASLACNMSAHLGKTDASESARSVWSMAAVGLLLWIIDLTFRTNWNNWPLGPVVPGPQIRMNQFLLLIIMMIGSTILLLVTTFQVMVLCLLASRQCRLFVAELKQSEREHDLLRSRSESEHDESTWA